MQFTPTPHKAFAFSGATIHFFIVSLFLTSLCYTISILDGNDCDHFISVIPTPIPIVLALGEESIYVYVIIILVLLLILFPIVLWFTDLVIVSLLGQSLIEGSMLNLGFFIFIFSEFMLFFAFFWAFIHVRLIPSVFMLYSFPPIYLVVIYPFAYPLANLFILLFSSIPLQSTLIFVKLGLKIKAIEELAHNISLGILFLSVQLFEYNFAFFSISSSVFASAFYAITGLHGFHVFLGALVALSFLVQA